MKIFIMKVFLLSFTLIYLLSFTDVYIVKEQEVKEGDEKSGHQTSNNCSSLMESLGLENNKIPYDPFLET